MELCGTYSLRQSFPSGERPVYGIEPATTVDNISKAIKYLSGSRFRGAGRAKDVLPLLMEGSASPMESVLALMLRLPIRRGGLGLGIPQLNPVIPIDDSYRRFTSMESFRPDIYFERIPIDLEYESEEFHPDLGDLDMLDAESRAAILKKSQSDKQRMRLIQSVGSKISLGSRRRNTILTCGRVGDQHANVREQGCQRLLVNINMLTALDLKGDLTGIRFHRIELIMLKTVFDLNGFDLRAFVHRQNIDSGILIYLTIKKLGDIFLPLQKRRDHGKIHDHTDERNASKDNGNSGSLLERRFLNVALCEQSLYFFKKIHHEWRLLT
jgi:hypothetical protein